ncbi:MAG: DUF2948 family protein [Rhodobacteraceae bacterium]|nr:DUF2948 family protein [Paracoccaceae bacterium]
MTGEDARYEDGAENPLRLQALDSEDLTVISTILQDAVLPITEMSWQPSKQRFGLLANRFRWEDKDDAAKQQRDFERVQAMVVVDRVLKVSSTGVDLKDTDQIISLLSVSFEAGEDTEGRIVFTLAGDGAIACHVECLELTLADVTRPYVAPSKSVPEHDLT